MFSRATDWFYEPCLFDSRLRQEIYRGSIMSGPVLGPIDPPIQWGTGVSLLRCKAFYSSVVGRLRISGAVPPLLQMSSRCAQKLLYRYLQQRF